MRSTKRRPLKKLSGTMAIKSFTSQEALQVAFKFSTLASTNRSSTTCDNSLRLLCYQVVKKLNDCTSFDGDWILGGNYKGNHKEHVEVNRLLKKIMKKISRIFAFSFDLKCCFTTVSCFYWWGIAEGDALRTCSVLCKLFADGHVKLSVTVYV